MTRSILGLCSLLCFFLHQPCFSQSHATNMTLTVWGHVTFYNKWLPIHRNKPSHRFYDVELSGRKTLFLPRDAAQSAVCCGKSSICPSVRASVSFVGRREPVIGQKTGATFYTAYNCRNIEQIFTKFGINHGLFILNIMP